MKCAWLLCMLSLGAAIGTASEPPDVVGAASSLIGAGNYEEAHRQLSVILGQGDSQPLAKDPRLWTLDGLALARLGQTDSALKRYESALHLAPDYLPALEGAAELKMKARRPEAESLLRKIVALQPANQTGHAMLGTLALERGDCAAAEQEFARSEQIIAAQPSALAQRGACLMKLHRFADAASVFKTALRLQPDERLARYNLAVSQLQAGLLRDAIATIQSAEESARDADMLDVLADAQEGTGDTPAAVATLRQGIVRYPDEPRLYLHFASLCLAHHSFQAGVEMLNAGILRSPQAQFHLARGILLVQLAQYSAAENDFTRADALDPQGRYAGALQGMAKLQQNQLPQAADDIRARLKHHPQDAFLHYLLAETLSRNGAVPGSSEFAEALKAADEAVELEPRLSLARDVLGRLYLQAGDTAAAIKQSRLAYYQDPTDQTALYHLIRALEKAGQTREIPELSGKLNALRQEAQKREMEERRYAIVVGPNSH